MNLSWLFPKLITPKAHNRDLAKLDTGFAGKQDREDPDPFSEASFNRRIKALNNKLRLDEIGKIAHLILVQKVAMSDDHKRYKLQSRDVQAAWDSASEIYDMTHAFHSKRNIQTTTPE